MNKRAVAQRKQPLEINGKFRECLAQSNTEFGQWLRSMAVFRTMDEVAMAFGYSKRTIYDWLNGRNSPTHASLILMGVYSPLRRHEIFKIVGRKFKLTKQYRQKSRAERYVNKGDKTEARRLDLTVIANNDLVLRNGKWELKSYE